MTPIITKREFLEFGFVPARFQAFICPGCKGILNAGPDYQPKFCPECGLKLDFAGIVFEDIEYLA